MFKVRIICFTLLLFASLSVGIAFSSGQNPSYPEWPRAIENVHPDLSPPRQPTVREMAYANAPVLASDIASNETLMLTAPNFESVRAGSSITFTINATESNNQTVTIFLRASGIPAGASMPPASGNPAVSNFSWAPAATQPFGNYTISFTASDNATPPLTRTRTVLIEVTKAILAPALTVPGPQAITGDTVLSVAVVATDLNLPPFPVTLSAFGLPTGAMFNPVTGVLVWTPSSSQAPGRYVITFVATNGQGGVTSNRVTITVSGPAIRTASLSVVPDQTVAWLLPISIGLAIGISPWVIFLVKRRRERKQIIGNGLDTSLKRERIRPSDGEVSNGTFPLKVPLSLVQKLITLSMVQSA